MALLKGNAKNNRLVAGDSNDVLQGLAGDDILLGKGGNDVLNGGLGIDRMAGDTGDDVYIVDNINDVVIEKLAAGIDSVRSYVSFALANYVENLFLVGTDKIDGQGNELNNTIIGNAGANTLRGFTGDDRLYGNAGNDVLDGQSGNDRINGGKDADQMYGGSGDDTFVVDHPDDKVYEKARKGLDTIEALMSYTLLEESVERLELIGPLAINGEGNSLSNTIIGNLAANHLSGGPNWLDNSDQLYGGYNDDILQDARYLYGESGNDLLRLDKVSKSSYSDINGGDGIDTLELSIANQAVDFSDAQIHSVETIAFEGNGNRLKFSAQDILDMGLKNDRLTLDNAAGDLVLLPETWKSSGVQGDYQFLHRDGVTVKINPDSHFVQMYTVSDSESEAAAKTVFNTTEQAILIDFGGGRYVDTQSEFPDGVIDLTGFGVEDFLVIALHDGIIFRNHHQTNISKTGSKRQINQHINTRTYFFDRATWKSLNHTMTLRSGFSGELAGTSNYSMHIIGLPSGVPDNHFVFI